MLWHKVPGTDRLPCLSGQSFNGIPVSQGRQMNVKRSLLLAAVVPGLMAGLCLAVMTSSKPTATFEGHTGEVNDVILSPDGKTIASRNGTVKLWDVTNRVERFTLEHDAGSFAFSPDSRTLATGGVDGQVKLWDVNNSNVRAIFQGEPYIKAVAFSPDGKTLASGRNSVQLWDVATGRREATLEDPQWQEPEEHFSSTAFSPDGKTLAVQCHYGRVTLWDMTRKEKRATLEGTWPGDGLAFSPDGKTVATGSGLSFYLWDVGTGQERAEFRHDAFITSVAFSADGTVLAASDEMTIILWDIASGQKRSTFKRGRRLFTNTFLDEFLPTFEGHIVMIDSVQFTPEGKLVALGRSGSAVLMWELATARK